MPRTPTPPEIALQTLAYRVQGLTKLYRTMAGEVRALRGVDLDIRQGETLVLLGPSGSAKSTLLNILGGLDRATGGRLYFHGGDLARASDPELTEYRRQYDRARALLAARRPVLDRLTDRLLREETVNGAVVREMLRNEHDAAAAVA